VAALEKDGFAGAETVSAFLTRRFLLSGTIVLVDEAGQIGGQQMWELLRFIKENDGRVILSGDTRQHGAVEATDALRAIEKYSGLQYAELTAIRRQNPDTAKTHPERQWLEQYKLAVGEAREGKLALSFDRLDKQNAIVACTLADQQQKLADHFLELRKSGHSTVVVSQSWSEIHKVNEQVRDGLKSQGLIGRDDLTVTTLS
jgi:ATP-dependent exoDNAse (exonuclease V) alpha subunit